jgi:hypothetical protein
MGTGKRERWAPSNVEKENDMKKALTIATFLTFIAMPAFAQSFDPDVGTGNIVPPVANQGGASAYAQAPDNYERGYVRAHSSRRMHHSAHSAGHNPKMIHNEDSND